MSFNKEHVDRIPRSSVQVSAVRHCSLLRTGRRCDVRSRRERRQGEFTHLEHRRSLLARLGLSASSVLTLLLAACSPSGRTSQPPAAVDSVVESVSLSAGHAGSEAPQDVSALMLEPKPGDSGLLLAAMDAVTAQCMAALGFKYVAIDLPTAEAQSAATFSGRRSDLPFDPAAEGPIYSPQVVAPSSTFDNDAYVRALPPAEQSAWSAAALGDAEDAVQIRVPQGVLALPRKGCLTVGRVRSSAHSRMPHSFWQDFRTSEREPSSRHWPTWT